MAIVSSDQITRIFAIMSRVNSGYLEDEDNLSKYRIHPAIRWVFVPLE